MAFDFEHAIAVARQFPFGTHGWITAFFHDAIEDGMMGFDEARVLFPPDIYAALIALTRFPEEETYAVYIERLKTNDLARQVKVADLSANLDRMDSEHESLRGRYENALDVLTNYRL